MPRKPSPSSTPPSGTFPVYLNPRLLAELVLLAQRRGISLGQRPAFSTVLRALLEELAGPEELWHFSSSEEAITFLGSLNFSLEQFSKKRYLRGQAREELAQGESSNLGAPSRLAILSEKLFKGELTEEEEKELVLLSSSKPL